MLIITRRSQEALSVGDDVVVQVLSIKGGQVRLGISAPRDKSVAREEVIHESQWQEICRKAGHDGNTPYARGDTYQHRNNKTDRPTLTKKQVDGNR